MSNSTFIENPDLKFPVFMNQDLAERHTIKEWEGSRGLAIGGTTTALVFVLIFSIMFFTTTAVAWAIFAIPFVFFLVIGLLYIRADTFAIKYRNQTDRVGISTVVISNQPIKETTQSVLSALGAFKSACDALGSNSYVYLPSTERVHKEAYLLVDKGVKLNKIISMFPSYQGQPDPARTPKEVIDASKEYADESRAFVKMCFDAVTLSGSVLANRELTASRDNVELMINDITRQQVMLRALNPGPAPIVDEEAEND